MNPNRSLRRVHRTALARLLAWAALASAVPAIAEDAPVERIVFASCADENRPQPIWDAIVAREPQLVLMLGDNVYADTRDMAEMREAYAKLAAVPGFAKLRAATTMLATWDDHDYGENDAGRDYPMRDASQKVFVDFWGDPPDSPRRSRPGVYMDRVFGPEGKRVQVLLLDTRYFRSPIPKRPKGPIPYEQDPSEEAEMLGEEQWKWLGEKLREPAELRVVGTSIQFGIDFRGVECWEEFPREKERMLKLLEETDADGVVFVSGDVHWGEIMRTEREGTYPLYEGTSSGLTHTWGGALGNSRRIGKPWVKTNFGEIEIDWDEADPPIAIRVRDEAGEKRLEESFRLSDIRRKR